MRRGFERTLGVSVRELDKLEKAIGGSIDHTLLTSIVDPKGVIRVQYIGSRFDPEEFRADLMSLVDETS